MDDKVLDYGDALLRVRDVALLTGPRWVNDALMAFAWEHQRRTEPRDDVALVDAAVTFLVANMPPSDVADVLRPLRAHEATTVLFQVRPSPPTPATATPPPRNNARRQTRTPLEQEQTLTPLPRVPPVLRSTTTPTSPASAAARTGASSRTSAASTARTTRSSTSTRSAAPTPARRTRSPPPSPKPSAARAPSPPRETYATIHRTLRDRPTGTIAVCTSWRWRTRCATRGATSDAFASRFEPSRRSASRREGRRCSRSSSGWRRRRSDARRAVVVVERGCGFAGGRERDPRRRRRSEIGTSRSRDDMSSTSRRFRYDSFVAVTTRSSASSSSVPHRSSARLPSRSPRAAFQLMPACTLLSKYASSLVAHL